MTNVTEPASIQPLLSVSQVAKSYGDKPALSGVSLTVAPGELVALLGPNGAGKSTLLQLVTGLFTPDSGTISVCGHDIATGMVPALAEIGVVFQQSTVDPELTVEANLRFHGELQGLSEKVLRAGIDAALARIGLTDRRRDRLRTLSGGNRRRLELVRALLHHPRMLIMDEATVGLDPASRSDILAHVLSLRQQGMGILWTTHLIDEAAQADRVVVLNKGSVAFTGTPTDLGATIEPPDLGQAFLNLTTPL